ncbi:MAG: hypothetical protein HZC37_15055 [Burkholderiales bacterium]|nr:hypothetical protein [Burkholderiales bacterium]
MQRELPLLPWLGRAPELRSGRQMAAAVLRRVSAMLARLALSVAGAAAQAPVREPVLEFYAEAGAPEGALYVDGVLVGMLAGVSRL